MSNVFDGVTVKVVGGLWWHVAECAKFLSGAWKCVTMTMAVISATMNQSASDLSIGMATNVIGRLQRCGVSKVETLSGEWMRD